MRETFADMYTDLQNDQYDYTFLQKLKGENEKKIIDVFVLVVRVKKLCIQETWEKAFNYVDRACKEIKLITYVCTEVSSLLPRTYQTVLHEGTQYLIKTKDKLKGGNMKFPEFKDLEIFKNGEKDFEKNLLQSCKDIEQFLPVYSFWKNIDGIFHQQMNDILGEKKQITAELTGEKQTQLILGFLSSYCTSNFKEQIKRIMDNDIPLSQLFHLFWQERLTVKTLSDELTQIVKVIGSVKFPDEIKDSIIRCLDLNLNLEKIAALRKFQSNIKSTMEDKCNGLIERFEEIQKKHSESKWSMSKTNALILDMESTVINFNDEVMGVIIEYSNSKHLISFLKDIMKEDIRNLMDAVEGEFFDQYLPLVSNLVEVKEFLHPILQLPEGTDTAAYILQIEKSLQKTEIQKAAVKISVCSKELDSLKNFYQAFSNKTEKTKDRIENILKNGEFFFKISEMECTMEILCTDGTKYTSSDLSDLRSRALLIQSRFEKKLMPVTSSNMTENLTLFLETVDAATEILETYQQLKMLGHPLFKKENSNVKLGDLVETNAYLCQTCDEWRNDLDEYRQKYSCLKYIKSEQLQLLFDFTKNFERVDDEDNKASKEADVKSVLWYLHPDLKLSFLDKSCISADDSPRHNLDKVVHCLEDAFKNLEFRGEYFPPLIEADSLDVKFSKTLNFICVDKDSGAGPNLILGWFLMKCNKLPLPSQVVVCSDNTSWDELYLMLLRSREQNNVSNNCFCIAFLELLPVEYQGMLINEIEKSDRNNSSLSLIYRGRHTDSIPTIFKDCEIYMQPLERTQMESLLQTMFTNINVFTSDLPGLGKTEKIRSLAASLQKGIKSLHISGPNNKSKLIQRLRDLDLKPYEILRIEIGLAERPEELDTFLFELVILRYVSFSSLSYVLPETNIALEIANCSNQMMIDSMPFSMCFKRQHLKWENYDNYRYQQIPNSPVQVACAYLGKLDNGDLNTDINLSSISLINEKKCQSLLRKYFPSFDGINFTLVDAFVSVLGNQLKKFSASAYFQKTNLGLMIGEDNTFTVRKTVLEALIQFSKEFASKSVASSRALQHNTFGNFNSPSVDVKNAVLNLASRTKSMVRWENSNHLVVVFHSQDTQTVSALYRCLKNVPENIKEMFQSQIKNYLPDYANMESDKLLEVIVKITRTKQKQLSKEKISMLAEGYAYTPDNMLKMMMIALRIQSNIPVVLMGETGCGKTSLIWRLADICGVRLKVFSVHAGLNEKDIFEKVRLANKCAKKKRSEEFWLFFDELNTSEYVGLISDIVCHRELNGNTLSPNLSFIAACNPYRLRESNRFTNGLQGKLSEDALSLLAYRVHPLPEMMLDFVWDYGSLPLQEESAYIQRMVESKLFKQHENVLILLLGESQQFVREKEGSSCTVSLRDVYRCISLIKWFKDEFIPQQHPDMEETDVLLRSFIMGLTICYLCRFSNANDRLAYRKKLFEVFSSNSIVTYSEKEIDRCVRDEHNAILDRMDIPKGTARNTALQENIFVMLICILNKLPLFIVGKPGCSKSLSLQLIRNNMRGKDSKHKFFQKYPRLFYSSFQGSESSTSDGIMKVFERAEKFEKQDSDVLSLVILDEIGLAEISRFNPLKVLHSLLEPKGKDRPEVAVVGISNWCLDSAKMNRAIHLSRPDMNEEDLFITGQSIMESVACHRSLDLILKEIAKAYLDYIDQQPIKNFHGLRDYYSFVKYVSRDFENKNYSVCELEFSEGEKMLLLKGLLRNFGGQQINNDTMRRTFFHRLLLQDLPICETKELIKGNIFDSDARHLMLMLDGDSALGSIESIIDNIGKHFTTILGSKFPDDENDEYNYRVLNRIILCMEQPQVLILKDLDDIYGSLYDMLNQNYTIVQGKKHCRVALGPFSNPTCEVNNDFKCIVIIDKSNIENTDPPFLNRFEKQQYLLRDILKPKNVKLAEYLESFVHDLSSYNGTTILFSVQDSFPIAGKEMFISLVNHVEQKLDNLYGKSTSETQVMYSCILELLWIFKPDCILRANISDAWAKSRNSVKFLMAMYMNLPIHNGLGNYLQETYATEEISFSIHEDVNKTRENLCRLVPFELKELKDTYFSKIKDDHSAFDDLEEYSEENARTVCETEENEWHAPFAMEKNLEISNDSSDIYLEKDAYETDQTGFPCRQNIQYQHIKSLRKSDGYGAKLVVFTFSTIYCKIQDALAELDYSLHKLSEYKTEKNFTKDVDNFFETSTKKWLVLQCDLKSDYHHILLAKSIIENSRKYLVRNEGIKHVCIVVHITQSTNPFHVFNKINYSTGWTLATLDSIENPIFSLPDLYNKPALDVLRANEQEFTELIVKELAWASAKMQYQGTSDNMPDVLKLKQSKCTLQFVSGQIQSWIRRHNDMKDNMDWQHRAACDKHLLETSATMIGGLESHLSSLIQKPLARILYSLENAGLLSCLLSFDDLKPELKDMFTKGCKYKKIYNVDAVPPPSGPGCYVINLTHNNMMVPFSKLIFENFENYRTEVLGYVRRSNIIPGDFQVVDNEKLKKTMKAIVQAYSGEINKETRLFNGLKFDHIVEDLRNDFCQFATSTIKCRLSEKEKATLMKWILNRLTGKDVIYDVSTFLMTLHLWTWTYAQNINGIFHLVDSWKTRGKCDDAISRTLYGSKNEKTMLESLQTFVDFICEDILSQCVELKHSKMVEWQEGVFKFMTIIGEIGITSHKTETLKFFNDFVSVVIIPTNCDNSHLNQFATCVKSCNWDLNKLHVFESLWVHLKSLSKCVRGLELQQIACSFIARCNFVDKGLEQKSINLKAINLIENGEMFDKCLRFYGHCLKWGLFDYFPFEEKDLESNLFMHMLENEIGNDDLDDFLYAIHRILGKNDRTSFSALLISTLEEEVFRDVTGIDKLTNISTQNDDLLRKLLQAQDALRSRCFGMRYSAAVAYLRKFLSVTATLIFTVTYRNKDVFSTIDQLMCSGSKSKEQKDVEKYFVCCLKRSSGDLGVLKLSAELSASMQFFRTSTLLPSVENIGWSLESYNLIRYCDLSDLLLLQSVGDISEDEGFLKRLVDKGKTSVASLLCFLHSHCFYVECYSKIADSDRLFVKSLEKTDTCLENNRVNQLLKHLVNQRNCKRDILRQSVKKSAESTSLTTFLVHVVSLILIQETKSSTLYKAAIHHEDPSCTSKEKELLTSFQIRTCVCSHRIVSDKLICPWCSSSEISGHFLAVCQPIKKEPFSLMVRNMLIEAALVTTCLFQDVVNEVGLKEVELKERSIQFSWQNLRKYLQVNDSEQCQLLMIYLENVKEIFSDSTISKNAWDPKYDDELRNVLQNRYQQLRKDNIKHDQLCQALRSTVDVENVEDNEKVETDHFYLTEKPSIQNLYFELHMSKSEEKFPFLNMILENLEMLQFPRYILGILQWHRLLITKCSYSLKKVDCKYKSVGSFINQQNKETQRDLRESFKIFSDKWEEIVTFIAKLEHHTTKLPYVEKITEDSIMDLCLLKDKTSTVFQVLLALCSLQNTLLDKVLELCVLFESKALGFLHLGPKQAAIPVVALMDLQTKHIIKSIVEDNEEQMELFSQVGCSDDTRGIEYDFRKIEMEWGYKVFHNKAHILIDETIMFMEFKDDLYGHCVQLLQKVSALIPQSDIDSATETKIKERLDDDSSQGPQLLTLIGTITTIIVRRNITKGHQSLVKYARKLEGLQLVGLSNNCLLPFTEYDLKLYKVVAFYTLLEEINGEKYFTALDTEFRDAIPEKTKQQITSVVSEGITLLRACESAMHVFLHRYLYIRDNDISLQQPIADYLSSTELWKKAKILNQRIILSNLDIEILLQDVFPQKLLVKHVYKFIELLKEQIRVSVVCFSRKFHNC